MCKNRVKFDLKYGRKQKPYRICNFKRKENSKTAGAILPEKFRAQCIVLLFEQSTREFLENFVE